MSSARINQHEHLFVYGTLRPPRTDPVPTDSVPRDSQFFPQIAAHLVSHVPGQVQNAELYDLGAYPAAVRGEGQIHGDLLTIEADALPITDRIEGHPTFYQRARVNVTSAHGETTAWIYWAPPGILLGRKRIASGDWFQRPLGESAESVFAPPDSGPVDETLRALIQRFAQADCSWLSTVRPDLRPQSSPIWHVWHQGRAYVVTQAGAVKAVNVELNPRVTITHPDPVDPIIIEGWAIESPSMRETLQPLFWAKYDWDISTDAAYATVLEITPTKLMAWGKHGEGRWRGEEILRIE